jgi:hypothetical protein
LERPIDIWQVGAASAVALITLIGIREVARTAPPGRLHTLAKALVVPVAVLFVLFVVVSVVRVIQILTSVA